jgi:hypothetical protein
MTLPSSFPLSASQINVELRRAPGAAFDIQGSAERALAEVPSGAISMSDFLGKQFFDFSAQGQFSASLSSSTTTVTNVAFGAANASRKVFVAINAEGGSSTGKTVNAVTIGGIAATIHVQSGDHNTGTNSTYRQAIASADVPTGTSGDVVITWSSGWTSGNCYVNSVRAKGLVGGITDTMTAQCTAGCSSESGTINMPSNGCFISATTGMGSSSPGITLNPGPDTWNFTVGSAGVAGTVLSAQAANASFSVSCSTGGAGDPSIGLVAITWQGQ